MEDGGILGQFLFLYILSNKGYGEECCFLLTENKGIVWLPRNWYSTYLTIRVGGNNKWSTSQNDQTLRETN